MLKKVMFHINSLGKGGAERVVANLSKEFVKKNIAVVVATEWEAKDEYPLEEQVSRLGVGLSEEEEALPGATKRKLRKKRLREAILREKPDVVYSFCRNANYRAVMAASGTKVPVIISVRSDPNVDYASAKHKIISAYLYGKAAGAVFQTPDARDFFPGFVAKKSTVIINPLHEKYLGRGISKERRKAIVSVGRFHEAKDQLVLIKAFELLMADYPEYRLEFYGDASEDNTIAMVKEYIASHRLKDRVILKGGSDSLEKDIFDAAVFVLSSKYEGMPNALMEAMALGLPVVSTDCPCGGPASIIRDGENGLLVKVGDAEEMAAAIKKYLDHPEKAEELGREAALIQTKAAPDAVAQSWISYAEKIMK